MTWANLGYLMTGVGIGWLLTQYFSRKQVQPDTLDEEVLQADPQAIEALQQQLQQAETAYYLANQMSQLKGSFLARTSHELRSPLNGLIGMHQLILADLCDSEEEKQEFIAQANASALKMVTVLDEVIDVAKVETGSSQLEIQPVQIANVLNQIYMQVHLQAQNRNIRLAIASVEPDLYGLADPRRLCTALVTLCSAAIADLQEGIISISATLDASDIAFHIETPITPTRWQEPASLILPTVTTGDLDSSTIDQKTAIVQASEKSFPTPSFSLLVAQKVFQSMDGSLELVSANVENPEMTEIRGKIPRLSLEASID